MKENQKSTLKIKCMLINGTNLEFFINKSNSTIADMENKIYLDLIQISRYSPKIKFLFESEDMNLNFPKLVKIENALWEKRKQKLVTIYVYPFSS